jgi:SAM-dependent methyltransferase
MNKLSGKIARKIPKIKNVLQEIDNLRTDKGVLQLEKGNLQADIRKTKDDFNNPRTFLAHQYIKGSGIEIGAAQFPVHLPKKAKVRYVDLFTEEDIRKAWPIYKKLDIVHIDVVDDAEKLSKFKPGSLDFIIANHFLEHCLDPIGTLINMTKKLRSGGVLFFAIPDKRYTFDKDRDITPYEHLLEEHSDKTKKFLWEHTVEFFTLAEPYDGDIEKRAREVIESGFRIHYHVWTSRELIDLFTRLRADFNLKLEIKAMISSGNEAIFILSKS